MYTISDNGIITLNAGDDFEMPVFINGGDEWTPLRYILQPGDALYFVVAEHKQPFDQAIIRKIFTYKDLDINGDVIVRLNHDDTKNVVPGTYGYEIKVSIFDRFGVEHINTIVPRQKFFILN